MRGENRGGRMEVEGREHGKEEKKEERIGKERRGGERDWNDWEEEREGLEE